MACSADYEYSSAKKKTAQLLIDSSILNEESATRTVSTTLQNTSLAEGNSVGAFIYRTGKTADDVVSGETYGYSNYKMDVTSTYTYLYNAAQPVFPYANRDIDVYAYAPYNSAWTTLVSTQTFTVAADQTSDANYVASDLLWVKKAIAFDTSNTGVSQTENLQFKHMLTQVCINVTAGDGVSTSSLNGVDVKLTGIGRTGTINLQTGAVAIAGANAAQTQDVTVFKYGYEQDGTTANASCTGGTAIIYPHNATEMANAKLQITIGGSTFTASLVTTNVTSFAAYQKYTYNVRVSSEGLVFSASISPWDNTADRPVNPELQ